MAIKQLLSPRNTDSLGILGYLIVVNSQVHSYQTDVIDDYLAKIQLDYASTPLEKILAGKEDALSFESSLSAYEGESWNVRRDLFYLLIVLASLDNAIDESEQNLINLIQTSAVLSNEEAYTLKNEAIKDAESFRISQNKLFEKPEQVIKSYQLKDKRTFLEIVRDFFSRFFRFKKTVKTGDSTINNDEYITAIEKCSHTAQEDYRIVLPSFSKIIASGQNCINDLTAYKQSISLETGLSAEVAKVVSCFIVNLNENVLSQCKAAEVSLQQKERTISDFTISLIGRTKAGKSTLHSILTNQGKGSIGQGKQRTTRFNRVYQWNLLRLIDTPGIGSPEANGRSDEQIAESVLGESDIICFVIVDDSILQDILEEIEKISALNKPIIVLLNHKDNIRTPAKFRRFLANPIRWLTDAGVDNLDGYSNRIMRYAKEHNFDKLITVYPVFLLAAQMASEEEYADHSRILWENSNIDSFINQIKNWISSAGSIKRSQTILDEPIQIINHSIQELKTSQAPIQKHIDKLAEERTAKVAALKSAVTSAIRNIQSGLQDEFENLASNQVLEFAELCYEKRQKPQKLWEDYIAEIGFEDEINSLIETEMGPFLTLANETIIELFEDLHYTQLNYGIGNIAAPTVDIDFKAIVRITGSVLGLAGTVILFALGFSNPVGWVLSVAGGLAGLGANLIESNPSKIKKSIDKTYQALKKNIQEQAPMEIEKTVSAIEKSMNDRILIIDRIYADLLSGLNRVLQISNSLEMVYLSENERLNKAYAWRIIQFLQNTEEPYSEEYVAKIIRRVERTDDRKLYIECDYTELNVKPLEGIIADQVTLVGG